MPSGRLVCRCHDVFLRCYVCFILLRFRLNAFVEAAALRSIVLRYASAPIATRGFGDVAFSEYFFVSFPLSLCMESTSNVISFRMVFFYLVITGWIFDISLCENSVDQSNQSTSVRTGHAHNSTTTQQQQQHSEGLLLRVGALPCAHTYNRGVVQHVVFNRLGLAQPHECSSKAMQTVMYKRPPTASNNLYRGGNCCTRHAAKATNVFSGYGCVFHVE